MDDPPSPQFELLCQELARGHVRPLADYLGCADKPLSCLDKTGRSLFSYALMVPGPGGQALSLAFLDEGASAAGVYQPNLPAHEVLVRHPLSLLAASSHSSASRRELASALLSHGALNPVSAGVGRTQVLHHLHRYHRDFHDMLLALNDAWSRRAQMLSEVSASSAPQSIRPAL